MTLFAFTLLFCLSYFSTLQMDVTWSPEISADFQRISWQYISEDRTLHDNYISFISNSFDS
jgi:hypothetical protein